MPLCLTITSYHKLTPGQCSQQQLGEGSLTIGRGPENDWVLPDPERLVSSRHCSIQFVDGAYYLTDLSTNGVLLVQSGLRLRRGGSERLQDGEVIRLGEYDLLAQISAPQVAGAELTSAPAASDPFSSFDALLNRQAAAVAPAADPGAARASVVAHFQGGSPLDTKPDLFDFLSPPPAGPQAVPDHLPAERHDFRPPTPQPSSPPAVAAVAPAAPAIPETAGADAAMIPADWDPFAELIAGPTAAPTPAAVSTPAPAPDPLFAPFPDSPLEPLATPAAPQDPWAPLAAPKPAAPPAVERRPEPQPQPAAAAPAPRPPSPPATGDLLQAFLRGAGVAQLRVEPADAEAQMEAIGRSYRQTVEGLIEVLRARASLKGEFRMQQTSIQPVQNNPLKFAPNVDEALLLLLRPGNQAFMAPDQAVTESFDDLKAHQLAVMAGVQAAIRHLLQRFEPAALETRFGKPSGLAGLLPGARQAQHWDNFTALYAAILREAEDDFQDLFGREFSRAYEAHSARLGRP